MRPVRFRRGFPPYNAGEIAGFPDDIAAEHVRSGRAEYLSAPSGPERSSEKPEIAALRGETAAGPKPKARKRKGAR